RSVTRAERACFERREDLPGEIGRARQTIQIRRTYARLQAAEPAAHGGHERGHDIVTEAGAQRRAQVANAVGKAEFDRLAAGPVFTGEQGFFWTLEPRAAAVFHEADEVLVDVPLQRLEPLHVLRVLRQER